MIWRKIALKITDYNNPQSFASKLRAKRLIYLLSLINEAYEKYGFVNIIDMGGTRRYWKILPEEYLSKYNIKINIVNFSSEIDGEPDEEFFSYLVGNCCDLADISDNHYHIAHSNSVIEHVGTWEKMKKFASEMERVAEKYYVQTPNFWFPIEPHCMIPFFHWLPRLTRVYLLQNMNVGKWSRCKDIDKAVYTIDSAQLINKKMFGYLFPSADKSTEKFFLLPKSLLAIKK